MEKCGLNVSLSSLNGLVLIYRDWIGRCGERLKPLANWLKLVVF